ncbi:MAG: hypothetical protein OEV92_01480 [Nitrospinota bacterium]|nr:hypothetical protein [Nitrospinota bacterium]
MEQAKRTIRYAAGGGALLQAIGVLYFIFVGPFDLRPHGLGIYIAGLEKPLVWLAGLTAIFLAATPFPSIQSFLARATLADRLPSSLCSVLAPALAAVSLLEATALAAYLLLGRLVITTPLGVIKISAADKPAVIALMSAMAALLFVSAQGRQKLWLGLLGARLHVLMALFTLTVCFIAGELAVRIAASRLPGVRYLVMAGEKNQDVVFPNLETYLASKPDIKPYMPLLNYYDNSLGMRDTEFETPKPKGRYRIMALGDSFTYGMVPYPDAVMTQVEQKLETACGGKDVEVLNFGINGGDLWDYKTVYELAEGRYDPDMVALHFYMGNDGPNLYYNTIQLPEEEKRRHKASGSYLARFIANLLTVTQSVETGRLMNEWAGAKEKGVRQARKAGGEVTPGLVITDDAPELARPYFVPARWIFYVSIIEVGVMYVADEEDARRQWAQAYEFLDEVAGNVAHSGRKLVIVLYPSSFQIYPERITEFLEGIKDVDKFRDDLHNPEDAERFKTIRQEFIKPDHPNRMMAEYCQSRGIACVDLTPALLAAAKASPKPLYRARETHWLIHGNHVAAEAEAEYLKGLICP